MLFGHRIQISRKPKDLRAADTEIHPCITRKATKEELEAIDKMLAEKRKRAEK